MTTRLVQKPLFKGTREFEIIEDSLTVHQKSLLSSEKLTIGLSAIHPDPDVQGEELLFYGRGKSEPLFRLYMNQPNNQSFTDFVEILRREVLEASAHSLPIGNRDDVSALPEAPGWNVYEEPPAFADEEAAEDKVEFQPVNPERLQGDIVMLNTYLDDNEIQPLLHAIEALIAQPDEEAALQRVADAYNDLGPYQGAVLTYAPYLKVILSRYIW
ncbi:MAG: hypothetical protein HUJ29_12680 [Gammaproteobacteria bacterium]|nr:hypothetical protein [Gammaproteobacteria bacterium]